MLERDYQRKVIELAHLFHWRVAHFRTAMNARGVHMTPVAADGKGWPDLVLVNPLHHRILFREVKADRGRLSPEQEQWGAWLTSAGQDWGVWQPRDWDTVVVPTLTAGNATRVQPRPEPL
jgi:hypothetical protein